MQGILVNRGHCHEFKAVIQTFEEMLMNHLVRDIWSGTPYKCSNSRNTIIGQTAEAGMKRGLSRSACVHIWSANGNRITSATFGNTNQPLYVLGVSDFSEGL